MHTTENNEHSNLKEIAAQQAFFREYHTWSSVPAMEDTHSLIYLAHQALDNEVPPESVTALFPFIHAMMAYHKALVK